MLWNPVSNLLQSTSITTYLHLTYWVLSTSLGTPEGCVQFIIIEYWLFTVKYVLVRVQSHLLFTKVLRFSELLFLIKFLEGMNYFCGYPFLDFWWHLLWVSKSEWINHYHLSAIDFIRFISGVTPADLLTASMAAELFWFTYLHTYVKHWCNSNPCRLFHFIVWTVLFKVAVFTSGTGPTIMITMQEMAPAIIHLIAIVE